MRGAVSVDAAVDVNAARAALARAVASGALGRACEVRADGDGFSFAGRVRGRIDVGSDGRVAYEADVSATFARWARAVLLAAFVAVADTIGWSMRFPVALAIGAVAGVISFVLTGARDRARVRRAVAALVRSLPVLIDARRE